MAQFSVSNARENFAQALETIQSEPVEITRHGKTVAVMIDPVAYERLVDAAEDAADIDALDQALAESDDTIPWDQVKEDLGLK